MRNPNGFGSVVFLGKNRRRPYAIRKTVGWELKNGTARQVYKNISYHETKMEALIALAKLNDRKIDVKKVDFTFQALYDEWFPKRTMGKSESTKNALKCVLPHIEPLLSMKIKDITEKDMQYLLDRCDKGYATKTNIRQVMQGVMEYAVTKGIRGDDPSALLNAGKQKTSEAHKAFKDEHLNKLKRTKGAEAIMFLAYTGLRVNELLALEIANISIEDRFMVGGIKTDEGKDRKIPIHRSQIPFLKKQMKDKKKYLFEYKGKKMKYLYFREHYWDNIFGELKMEYTPHDARHTFVTNMRKAGVDLLVVQKMVGHIPKSTTEKVYTHIGLDELIAAIDMLP